MTKKDYIALARVLREARVNHVGIVFKSGIMAERLVQWQLDIQYVADALEDDNARFDRAKFIEACNR